MVGKIPRGSEKLSGRICVLYAVSDVAGHDVELLLARDRREPLPAAVRPRLVRGSQLI
jgi:hypothetical protein